VCLVWMLNFVRPMREVYVCTELRVDSFFWQGRPSLRLHSVQCCDRWDICHCLFVSSKVSSVNVNSRVRVCFVVEDELCPSL